MKLQILLLALLFSLCSCNTTKINNYEDHAWFRADDKPEIELAQSVGHMLYILDKASAIGTDVLLENVSDLRDKKLGGYITFREGDEEGNLVDSYRVSFYTNEEPPRIKWDIHVKLNNEHEFVEHSPPKETTPSFRGFIKARQAAINAIPERVQPINPVILPGDIFGKKGYAIYLLAGTTEPDTAVFGKHYRAFVDPDNDYAVEIEPLSKSVLESSLRGENDEKVVALLTTQLLTDYPTEIHVFANLLYKTRVYVAAGDDTWIVEDGNIYQLREN